MPTPAPPPSSRTAWTCGGDDVRLGGLELTVADPDAVLGAARDAAWDDAKAKAEQYAARAGRTLGAVVEITEDTSTPVPVPRPRMRGATEIAYAAAAVPVELGESELAADLRVTWELD